MAKVGSRLGAPTALDAKEALPNASTPASVPLVQPPMAGRLAPVNRAALVEPILAGHGEPVAKAEGDTAALGRDGADAAASLVVMAVGASVAVAPSTTL